ncbi:MAG TPA: acyl-CoA desaturase [Polyangiaceae bacterium]|jgi:stearoyl-CoA desaturase (delta-9 desaturase)|nr:acyl-CoA desaturase [Polyangiaceae bacterium]
MSSALSTQDPRRIAILKASPFFAIQLAAVAGIFWFGWSWKGALLALALYYVRMFAVTGVYHRYFSHRTYKTSRVFQFLLAVLAMTSVQKGVLWWASHHRTHHRNSDQPTDVHSVLQDGFWWSHVGWIVSRQYDTTDLSKVKDLARFPELRFLDRYHVLVPIAYATALWLAGGTWAIFWGFFVSTTLLWHGTFTINSLTHVFGTQRYITTDNSRNHWLLALITMGEGWHNNHHYYQRATNQGFFWWEIDPTYYVLRVLSWFGLVWDLHVPPPHVLNSNRIGSTPVPVLEPALEPIIVETPAE